ncbi:MAG: 23S rRNA (pseudouridine(1915)-N(3))-methyltransferase RlmH, partial [Desulfobulbaceae bacterium]|nr:23S rRNA (pseudouridine(1915)-N(3))-methyltransferase RlmH [Desulfobulbaceae bacterium]
MRIKIVYPGKTREGYIQAGIDDFMKRLKRFTRLDARIVKDKRGKGNESEARIKEEEGKRLVAALDDASFVVALDSAGRQVSSEKLAALISGWENQNRKCVSFVVGGALGLSPEVLKQADMVLSLSKMTFTHEMARLILLEQIYRAYTIKA